MSNENVAVVRGLYQGFARGDLDAVLRVCDSRIEWHEAENFIYADRSPYIGPQAVSAGLLFRLGTEWTGFSAVPERFLDAGDTVVTHGYYSGTYQRTGKAVKAQFAHLFTLRGSGVARSSASLNSRPCNLPGRRQSEIQVLYRVISNRMNR